MLVIGIDVISMKSIRYEAARFGGGVTAYELPIAVGSIRGVTAGVSAHGVIPPPEETGVILAVDLYSDALGCGRGASGDVRRVWEAFGASFKWVVGVAGNHDEFGSLEEMARFRASDRMELLA